jgi:hypothetical protein
MHAFRVRHNNRNSMTMMKITGIALACLLAAGAASATGSVPVADAAAAWHVQPGFAATPHAAEYAAWQTAFAADLKALRQQAKENPAVIGEALQEGNEARLTAYFAHSIDDGAKGTNLMKMIAAAYTAQGNRDVWPAGLTLLTLTLGTGDIGTPPAVKAAGYGCHFQDAGRDVELFYTLPFDPEGSTLAQMHEDALYGTVFPNLHLPALGTCERDAWPAMVFVRNDKGELMLYAMSREMAALIDRIFTMQIA